MHILILLIKSLSIWRHSAIILTGVDVIVGDHTRKSNSEICMQTLLETWTRQINWAIDLAIGNVYIQLLLKVFPSYLLEGMIKSVSKDLMPIGSFLSSKVQSMPAILKLAVTRIIRNIANKKLQQLQYYQQPINDRNLGSS